MREVLVSSFAIAKHELTFVQWDVCTEYGPCRWVPDEGWGRGDRPVINVNWDDVQTYVSWLSTETRGSFRLPSEAEWEYAARAGTESRYQWGNDIGRNRAHCEGCGSRGHQGRTMQVGSFEPNAFGLNDLHGNVWEWVQDCTNDDYRGALSDGSPWLRGNCSRRMLRGGSWSNEDVRVAGRTGRPTDYGSRDVGCRIATSLGQ